MSQVELSGQEVSLILEAIRVYGNAQSVSWGLSHDGRVAEKIENKLLSVGAAPGGGSPQAEKFERLAKLEKNWDSYGGNPISADAIQRAQEWLANVQVVPMSDGGVQLEWHSEGRDVELAFRADGSLEAWAGDDSEPSVGVARPGEDGATPQYLVDLGQALFWAKELSEQGYDEAPTMLEDLVKEVAWYRSGALRGTPQSRTTDLEREVTEALMLASGPPTVRALAEAFLDSQCHRAEAERELTRLRQQENPLVVEDGRVLD